MSLRLAIETSSIKRTEKLLIASLHTLINEEHINFYIKAHLFKGSWKSKPLLEVGTHFNKPHGEKGNTPLHKAVLKGGSKVLRILFDQNLERIPKNKRGETPLGLAVSWGDYDCAKALIDYGAYEDLLGVEERNKLEEQARLTGKKDLIDLLKKTRENFYKQRLP